MNKNMVIILALVALFVLGVIGYAMRGISTSDSANKIGIQDTSEITNLQEKTDDMSLTGNLLDLINKGSDLQCTFSGETDGTKTSGTTYISGKKVRGDYKIEVEGKVMESNLISDNEYMYTWSSEMAQGMKMKIDEFEKSDDDNTSKDDQAKQEKNMEAFQDDYDYNCTKWNVDDSKFNVPTNIEFTDYSAMMKNVPTSPDNLCSACDMIQEAGDKAECKAQLNCN